MFQLHSVPALCFALHLAAFFDDQSDPFPIGTPEVSTVGINGFEADVGAAVVEVVVVAVVVVL